MYFALRIEIVIQRCNNLQINLNQFTKLFCFLDLELLEAGIRNKKCTFEFESCVFSGTLSLSCIMTTERSSLQCLSADIDEFEVRIKDELETLNLRISSINKLGQEAGEAERIYDDTLDKSFELLKSCAVEIGVGAIERARPYFRLVKRVQEANEKVKSHKAAFERANEHCNDKKYRVRQVEERVMETIGSQEVDIEGLEMLNQAIEDVVEAVDLKFLYTMKLHEYELSLAIRQKKLVILKKALRYDIQKARPYFDLKSEINRKLHCQKEMVDSIKNGLRRAKKDYNETMELVEKISEQIHIEREKSIDRID